MSVRFSDNILSNLEGSGFVVRSRVPRSVQIVMIFLLGFDAICFAAYLMNESNISFGFLMILLISIGGLGFVTYFFLSRFRKLILATEFQTAIFASAAQLGTRFCFVVNGDGLIFYVDPGFQKFFSSFIDSGNMTIKSLLEFTEVSDDLRVKMFTALRNNKSDHVILSFKSANGEKVNIMTTIDVIPRPKGYFIIRGRDYVEKRTVDKTDENKNLALLYARVMYNMPVRILIIAAGGKIAHVSRELESWLGYGQDEIVQSKIMTGQILYQYNGHDAGVLLMNNFDGEIIFQRKDRSMIASRVHQTLLLDGDHKLGIATVVELDAGRRA